MATAVWKRTLLAALTLLLAATPARADEDSRAARALAKGFQSPPQAAKPWVYWFWMNCNISREGITKDLEEMKKVGLGGALICNVTCGIPAGPVIFNSPQWHALVAHAVSEAGRLGLELRIYTGGGWSMSGGPWVTSEHSMQMLTWSQTCVRGPARFAGRLPQPPATRQNQVQPYYRDIAVLAYGLPAGAKPMSICYPKVTTAAADQSAPSVLIDGDRETGIAFSGRGAKEASWVQLEFDEPFIAQALTVRMLSRGGYKGELQVSDHGKTFARVSAVNIPRNGPWFSMGTSSFPPTTGRFFRLTFTHAESNAPIGVGEIELHPDARIPDWACKAGFLKPDRKVSSQSDGKISPEETKAGKRKKKKRNSQPLLRVSARDNVVNLTDRMNGDGLLTWEVPEGAWTILRLGQTSTGGGCHPAPEGGEGLDVDKFSKEALEAFWNGHMARIVSNAGPFVGKSLTGVHTDSWECGPQNWTVKFRDEFQVRRGYDPLPYLPAMIGVPIHSAEISERFLWDVRRTISDLCADNYFGHLRTLARQHGMVYWCESYGATGNFEDFQVGSRSDIPMGTYWADWRAEIVRDDPRCSKLSASIAHTFGKKYVGAEAFSARPQKGTGTGRWLDHPYSLKALGDVNGFCSGINRMCIACCTHQPWTDLRPGMTMGRVGIHFDWPITWWAQARAWTAYLSRCQWLLQQGIFSADVCAFTGEDAPNYSAMPRLPAGYDWDLCNAEVILERMSLRDGRIVLPDGMSYRYLALPDQMTMTPQVLRKVRDLVAAGATVVGPPPAASPSLSGYPSCDEEVRKLAANVWGPCDGKKVKEHSFRRGRVIWGKSWQEIFTADKLVPDFSFSARASDSQIYAIHRTAADLDLYFLANAGDQAEETVCTFRVSGKVPEFWHPDTGVIEHAAVWRERDGRTEVFVPFDPRGSVFVVFRPGQAAAITALAYNGRSIFPDLATSGAAARVALDTSGATLAASAPGEYALAFSSGSKAIAKVDAVPAALEIVGPWHVSFPAGLGAPESALFERLISWPEHSAPGIKYFSGTATYSKEIEIPANMVRKDLALTLDLGRVEIIAELVVNGKDLGILWKPPFAADITASVKPGKNTLSVKVVNLWPNRLVGDEQLPADVEWTKQGALEGWPRWLAEGTPRPLTDRTTFTTWRHWKRDDRLLPSGLIGPVRLLPWVKVTLH